MLLWTSIAKIKSIETKSNTHHMFVTETALQYGSVYLSYIAYFHPGVKKIVRKLEYK